MRTPFWVSAGGAIVVSLMLANQAWAGFDEGVAAYKRGNYVTAAHEFRLLAEQGDARVQFALAAMYDNGQGVPQDHAAAVKWHRLAAEQGNASAQLNLGTMYDKGRGVPQDDAAAAKWFRLAADQGSVTAQFNLAVMYDLGRGVPQDFVQFRKWYNLAASRFPASEKERRDTAVKNRDLVAAEMTPAQIAGAQKLAHEWRPK